NFKNARAGKEKARRRWNGNRAMDQLTMQSIKKPAEKSNSLEIRREKWLRQLMADPKIEFSHFKVATVIGWHMNRNKGGVAWPGILTIGRIASIHPRTAIRAIERLEERGHLQVTRTRRGKRKLPNRYLPLLKHHRDVIVPEQPQPMSLGSGIAMPVGS